MIIAANAEGASSPIGDVITIMLWIGGQVTAVNIVTEIFLPSLVSLLVPLGIVSFKCKGDIDSPIAQRGMHQNAMVVGKFDKNPVFVMGIGALLFVPVFKTLTHLPPFMGMLFGLSVVWITTELIHRKKSPEERKGPSIAHVLQKNRYAQYPLLFRYFGSGSGITISRPFSRYVKAFRC